jgi:glycosyltransferase involved in cell wall biosynthesis
LRFSILVPSYNRPEYIRETLVSIFKSSFVDFEVLVSDDCSPRADIIQSVLSEFSEENRLRCFFQKDNLKEPNNKNFLVSKAKGDYLIFIGDDDVILPNALGVLDSYIDACSDVALFSFGYNIIDESNVHIYKRLSPVEFNIDSRNLKTLYDFFASDIIPFWFFHPATFCCKRRVEMEIKYIDNIGIGEDFMFLFDVINQGYKIKVIPYALFKWRKIQNSECVDLQKNQSLIDGAAVFTRAKILERLESSRDLNPEIRKIVNSERFRIDFLYKPMLEGPISERENICISNDKKTEFNKYKRRYSFLATKIDRLYRYINITGIVGFYNIWLIFIGRIMYKLKK